MLAVDPRRFGPYASKRYVVHEERGDLPQRLHDPLPGRGTPGCASREDEPRLRQAEAHGRGVRPALRLGARQLVRAGRRRGEGRLELPPHATISSTSATSAGGCASGSVSSTSRRSPSTTSSGPGAEAWLDGLVANKVPTKIGRMALSHALTKRGGIRSEFTITKLGDDRFYLVSAGRRRALRLRPPAASGCRPTVPCVCATSRPRAAASSSPVRARATCSRSSPTRRSTTTSFPWLTRPGRRSRPRPDVYRCASTSWARSAGSCTSRSSTRITCSTRCSPPGAEFGIGMVGMRAMESLRIEKSYRMWGSDLTRDNTPLEAGLDRFVRMKQGRLRGRGRRSSASSRPACRTVSSRSTCTASPTRTRSATSRCSTARAA